MLTPLLFLANVSKPSTTPTVIFYKPKWVTGLVLHGGVSTRPYGFSTKAAAGK
jgi:hypothetical protein